MIQACMICFGDDYAAPPYPLFPRDRRGAALHTRGCESRDRSAAPQPADQGSRGGNRRRIVSSGGAWCGTHPGWGGFPGKGPGYAGARGTREARSPSGVPGRDRLAAGRLHASAAFNPVVPSAIRTFRRAYPDVAFTLAETNTIPLSQSLRDGTLEAAFLRPEDTGSDALQLRLLSEEPMMVVLPSAHPIAARAKIELAMLKDEPLLLVPRAGGISLFDTIVTACREAGFEPEYGQSAPQIDHTPVRIQ